MSGITVTELDNLITLIETTYDGVVADYRPHHRGTVMIFLSIDGNHSSTPISFQSVRDVSKIMATLLACKVTSDD